MNPESVGNQTRLKVLPEEYEAHCRAKGLKESSIQLYVKLSRRFLAGLESAGAETVAEINADRVMQACLSLKSTYRSIGDWIFYPLRLPFLFDKQNNNFEPNSQCSNK